MSASSVRDYRGCLDRGARRSDLTAAVHLSNPCHWICAPNKSAKYLPGTRGENRFAEMWPGSRGRRHPPTHGRRLRPGTGRFQPRQTAQVSSGKENATRLLRSAAEPWGRLTTSSDNVEAAPHGLVARRASCRGRARSDGAAWLLINAHRGPQLIPTQQPSAL